MDALFLAGKIKPFRFMMTFFLLDRLRHGIWEGVGNGSTGNPGPDMVARGLPREPCSTMFGYTP